MIDLNYRKQNSQEHQEEDWPLGVQILVLMPFAVLFWAILTASFIHGIY